MSNRRILGGAAANIYGQAVSIGTQLLGVPILIAGWGLDGFGLWTLMAAVPTLLISMDFGYSAAAAGMMSKAIAHGDEDDALTSLHSAFLVISGMAAALVAMAIGFWLFSTGKEFGPLGGLSASEMQTAARMVPFILTYVAISLVSGLVAAVYRVNGRYPTGIMIFETGRLVEQLLVMGVAFASGSLVLASALMVVSRITFTTISTRTMLRLTPWARLSFAKATRERLRALLHPALGAMFIPLCILAGVQGVTFAVGIVLSPAVAGAFASVRVLFRMVVQIVGTLTRATVPDFAIVHARGDHDEQRRIVRFTLAALFSGAVIGTGGVLVLGPAFIDLWTNGKVAIPYGIYLILGFHAFFGCIWNGISNLLTGLNLHPRYVPQLIGWNVVCIASLAVTVPAGGLYAASMTLAAIDILSFISVWRIWRTVMQSGAGVADEAKSNEAPGRSAIAIASASVAPRKADGA